MVQLEKIPGQVGNMAIQEDGALISSFGELASSEATAQHIVGLVSNVFTANFAGASERNSDGGGGGGGGDTGGHDVNGHLGSTNGVGAAHTTVKWNRITVSFGDKSYVACLSNRKIHIAKREHEGPKAVPPSAGT